MRPPMRSSAGGSTARPINSPSLAGMAWSCPATRNTEENHGPEPSSTTARSTRRPASRLLADFTRPRESRQRDLARFAELEGRRDSQAAPDLPHRGLQLLHRAIDGLDAPLFGGELGPDQARARDGRTRRGRY